MFKLHSPTSDSSFEDVVNPPKSYKEVFEEGQEGHDLYIVSHNDYYVGEAKNRKYNPSSFHRFNLYGVPTPHFNDGRNMAKTKRGAKIVSKKVDDFKEKFQHKLGRVLDPIAETMNVPPDHTFGACLHPDEYGAGDLIHRRLPGEYLRGKDRQRALVAAVRHHLKKVNYQNFDTLLAAFRHYDKHQRKGDGAIDKAELREACDQACLHLDEKLLDQLFEYCDVDNDGLINYLEFANFLTWKDKTRLKEYEERVIIKEPLFQTEVNRVVNRNIRPCSNFLVYDVVRCPELGFPQWVLVSAEGSYQSGLRFHQQEETSRKSDCANPAEANVEESEPALLIKSEDIVFKEPGSSEKTVRTLLRPSDKVSNHYKTTSSEISAVIAEILCNIGVKLSDDEFENVWNLASKKHHRGEVCVENIRNVLDELLHADRTKCKTAT
ncbi:EF-hand domain-containing family member B [Camelus dromedarius]|uniref:EF-hand domain-containing family member B n=1 Tax=Camelus dromedarius TaxID=9838 RepID=A0A5N4ELB5_CAMDR|nr:EF-hand domain-containing family member B [Camelus dromedarius]